MAGRGYLLLFSLALCVIFHITQADYMITTLREVILGSSAQICVFVADPSAPEGAIRVVLVADRFDSNLTHPIQDVILDETIEVPQGNVEICEELPVESEENYFRGQYNITGNVSGKSFNHTAYVDLRSATTERIFIQNDKHIYLPEQMVQFRILSLVGPKLNVSTLNYPEIRVMSPSGTRIAQWNDVNNTAGLVHLSLKLDEEPEEGDYQIIVKSGLENTQIQTFKVEKYVLPRYELKITPPSYVLATHSGFNFTVCADYTFGRPVKGTVDLKIDTNERQLCRVIINKTEDITGCNTFELSNQELKVTDCNVYSVNVEATFEEEGTGIIMKDADNIGISRNAINFVEIYSDRYMKPNLPFTVKVRTEFPDGSVAPEIPVEVCAAGICNTMASTDDGVLTVILPNYGANRILMRTLNCQADLYGSSYERDVEHFYSPSNSSLLIHAPEEELKCSLGETVQHILPVFFSATNQTSAVIHLQVISRGQIQYWWTSEEYEFIASDLPIDEGDLIGPISPTPENTVRGVLHINLSLPSTVSPSAKVLVWYIRDDGEVVSDSRELRIEKCLPNSANLTWADDEAEPGDETSFTLSSAPYSVCSLDVVDKSTQLLSQQPDPITVENIFSFVEGFNVFPWSHIDDNEYCRRKLERDLLSAGENPNQYHFYSLYVDSLKMFDDSGLQVFTDLKVETRPCEKETFGRPIFFGFTNNRGTFSPDRYGPEIAFSLRGSSGEPRPRTDFPETWLWDLVVVPSSGVYEEQVTLPDTVTEWVGHAVCVHPEEGVGVSQKQSITTVLPFFIDLTLPPSIKRGEILPVNISVFNYLGTDLPVTVRLAESTEYDIVMETDYEDVIGQRFSCIPSGDKVVHTVRINATVLGMVKLNVTAYVDYETMEDCDSGNTSITRRDTIIKPIRVVPEGFPRENTWTKYICAADFVSGEDSLEVWAVAPPSDIVEGSERGWVSAVGDLVALTLENLGHLIQMPYGCGEQNMINFAPSVFISDYLHETNQNTPEVMEKLLRFMRLGYRREQLYRRSNGSYSAFGNADDSGSTWLTAFVYKSFRLAQKFISVDMEALNETRIWLEDLQDDNGCFLSVGQIFTKGLLGGVSVGNTSIPLTAYVTISLLEADEDSSSATIEKAIQCLATDASVDPYTMALKAYAYVLALNPGAERAIKDLLGVAVVTTNAIHWELPISPSKSKGVELETAAYAILAMINHDSEKYFSQILKVVQWITVQINGAGGFYSTQDTVMALQALTRFEIFFYQNSLQVEVLVEATDLFHTFTITESNKLLHQMVHLPVIPTNVTLGIEGQGCVVVQAVLRYNVLEPGPGDALSLSVEVDNAVDRQCITKFITVCATYLLPDGKSNMAIIEVNLVSGYVPNEDDLKQIVKKSKLIKMYEVDENKEKVVFYIEELTANPTCLGFRMRREVKVENVKPAAVVVYDYYQPEFSLSKSYILPPAEECFP